MSHTVFKKLNNVSKIALIYFFTTLYFYAPIQTLYLQGRGFNLVQINSIWSIIVATSFLADIPTGILADKIGKKQSIILSVTFQLVGEILFIFVQSYWMLALSAIVGGLGIAFASGAIEALVYDSLQHQGTQREMAKATGFIHSFRIAPGIIAPLIGGAIAVHLTKESFILLIFLTIVSIAVGLLLCFTLKEPSQNEGMKEDVLKEEFFVLLKEGFKVLQTNKSLRRIVLLMLLATPFGEYLVNLYQPYFLQAKVPSIWLGLAYTISSIILFCLVKYAYLIEKKLGMIPSILIATVTPGILYVLMGMIVHPIFSVLIFCVCRGSASMQTPLFADYRNTQIESKNRTTVLSILNTSVSCYTAVMGLLIGYVADRSVPYAFIFMGCIIVVGSILFRIKKDESIEH